MTKTKNKENGKKKPMKTEVEKDKLTHYDIANRSCNLECLKGKKKEPDNFTGLVKLVLIETPKSEYFRRVCWAGFIGLAYLMMGSVSTLMFYFTFAMILPVYENLHVFLCTAGFQLLIPAGILMISDLNGPSVPLSPMWRRYNHILLQISGLGCGLTGAFMIVSLGNKEAFMETITVHFISGMIACGLTFAGAIFGPFLVITQRWRYFRHFHFTLGASGFLFSSLCFITGITRPSLTNWLPLPEILYFLIILCVLYTLIVFLTPIIRCMSCKNQC